MKPSTTHIITTVNVQDAFAAVKPFEFAGDSVDAETGCILWRYNSPTDHNTWRVVKFSIVDTPSQDECSLSKSVLYSVDEFFDYQAADIENDASKKDASPWILKAEKAEARWRALNDIGEDYDIDATPATYLDAVAASNMSCAVLNLGDDLFCVTIRNALDDDGNLTPYAKRIVKHFFTYCERAHDCDIRLLIRRSGRAAKKLKFDSSDVTIESNTLQALSFNVIAFDNIAATSYTLGDLVDILQKKGGE